MAVLISSFIQSVSFLRYNERLLHGKTRSDNIIALKKETNIGKKLTNASKVEETFSKVCISLSNILGGIFVLYYVYFVVIIYKMCDSLGKGIISLVVHPV